MVQMNWVQKIAEKSVDAAKASLVADFRGSKGAKVSFLIGELQG